MLSYIIKGIMKVYNQNSLVNLSNSILKNFHCETFHDTIPEIDAILKGHKKVVAVLFDGMGRNITRKHLKEDSFIRKHYVTTINSTYPPTTAAATTAFLTGRYPIETGWLGWNLYFKELDRNVILFKNQDYNTEEYLNEPYSYRKFPITPIFQIIESNNKNIKALPIQRFPIQQDGPKYLMRSGVNKLNKVLKENDECFIYFYWDSPDCEMHENGIDSKKVHYQVLKAQRFMERVTKDNPDTLFILLADHGHINVEFFDICKHDDIYSLIDKPLSLEKRTISFFVKEGKKEEFVTLFNKYYGQYFELLSKEEALNIKLFGEGNMAPGVYDSIGDYIAISHDKYGIVASKELQKPDKFKGHHAGGTEEERLIDIAIFNR